MRLCQWRCSENLCLTFHQVALWTLGQQVASTGYVVEPYRKYPSLLEVLLNFLKTEQNQGIRREVCTSASILAPNLSFPHSLLHGNVNPTLLFCNSL